MDEDRILENERLRMEQIRQLDMEELLVEEVDGDGSSDDEVVISNSARLRGGDGGAGPYGFTYNTCLASLHTYLGEVDDTHGKLSFLDGGAVLNLPMFYLEGVVLFPEATLPLRVIQRRFIAAVERALNNSDAPYTIGVVCVHKHLENGIRTVRLASTGTTAEIRQYRRMDDGSLNVVTRGQQRFHLKRHWIDAEGAPCGEVQIITEDTPLKTPRNAFGLLASVPNRQKHHFAHRTPSTASPTKQLGEENDWGSPTATSITSADIRLPLSATESSDSPFSFDDLSSSDDEFMRGQKLRKKRLYGTSGSGQSHNYEKKCEKFMCEWDSADDSPKRKNFVNGESLERTSVAHGPQRAHGAAMTFWPQWVYQMYDSYSLAQRAADLWGEIIGTPRLDDYTRKPDILSFYIASKLPLSESTRQELLEIDGISYRLQREIQLLTGFNIIRCKNCQTLIAKRSDMLVMSSDGPLNAYVNPHGFVHEIITVHNASGLVLSGGPVKEHSWFPGYAWTISNCAVCESNMGWLFSATKRNLLPRSFWGIRSSQVVDDSRSIKHGIQWEA